MINELKVYNPFGELTLHLRHTLDGNPELLTVDGTPEMRLAIADLKGNDFDRSVAKGRDLVRLTADWNSPKYLSILARFFVMNFGWSTRIVETQRCAAAFSTMNDNTCGGQTSGYNSPPQTLAGGCVVRFLPRTFSAGTVDGYTAAPQSFFGGSSVLIANISEDRPEIQTVAEAPSIVTSVPLLSETPVYGISAG